MSERTNTHWEKAPEELIRKYSGSGPRYTSYPTAVEFHHGFGEKDWLDALSSDRRNPSDAVRSQGPSSSALSLYLHLPFCHTLCYFCACNKVITRDYNVVGPYLEAIIKEIGAYRERITGSETVEQIHWGGGTPNYLSPQDMERLHRATLDAFPALSPEADVSVEIDPRTTSSDHIRALASLGFRRVSLGVQDFSPLVQETVNRIQPFAMTKQVIDWARDAGFAGVNLDLIYGLPNQNRDGFIETVKQVLTLRPDRVALYGYAHVTWIKKVQKALERAHLPTASERIDIFSHAIELFTEAGYDYIGLDHFALPEDGLAKALRARNLNRNFMGYTTHSGARILGFGASAISTLPRAFAQNVKDVTEYQRRVAATGFATERGLRREEDDCIRADAIESILVSGELCFTDFEKFWGRSFPSYFESEFPQLQTFADDGLLELLPDRIVVTALGRLFARNIAMTFDAYLEKHRQAAKPVFSQAV